MYDAVLARLQLRSGDIEGARQSDIASALALASRQGATLFELRAAVDDFQLRGAPARAALVDVLGRIPSDSTLPEVARAKTLLANG